MPKKNKKMSRSRGVGDGLRGYSTVSTPSASRTESSERESERSHAERLVECQLRAYHDGRVSLSLVVTAPPSPASAMPPVQVDHAAHSSSAAKAQLQPVGKAEPALPLQPVGKAEPALTAEGRGLSHASVEDAAPRSVTAMGASTSSSPLPRSPKTCLGGQRQSEPPALPRENTPPVFSPAASCGGTACLEPSQSPQPEVSAWATSRPIPVRAASSQAASMALSAPCERSTSAWSRRECAAIPADDPELQPCSASQSIAIPATSWKQRLDRSEPLDQMARSAPADLVHFEWPQLNTDCPPAAAVARADEEEAFHFETGEEQEEEGVMCAICHGNIKPMEVALIRGCDHPFCCNCILNWSQQKKKCPLCNTAFTHLWLYRMLDGTLNDYLIEENVDLLHRACWFRKAVVTEFSPQAAEDEEEEYHEMLQYMYGGGRDAEEDEDYYLDMQDGISRARLRGRAVGNRMWGTGGIAQGGRRAARATPLTPVSAKKKGVTTPIGSDSPAASSGDRGGGSNSSGGYSRKAEIKAQKMAQKESQKDRRRELARRDGLLAGRD